MINNEDKRIQRNSIKISSLKQPLDSRFSNFFNFNVSNKTDTQNLIDGLNKYNKDIKWKSTRDMSIFGCNEFFNFNEIEILLNQKRKFHSTKVTTNVLNSYQLVSFRETIKKDFEFFRIERNYKRKKSYDKVYFFKNLNIIPYNERNGEKDADELINTKNRMKTENLLDLRPNKYKLKSTLHEKLENNNSSESNLNLEMIEEDKKELFATNSIFQIESDELYKDLEFEDSKKIYKTSGLIKEKSIFTFTDDLNQNENQEQSNTNRDYENENDGATVDLHLIGCNNYFTQNIKKNNNKNLEKFISTPNMLDIKEANKVGIESENIYSESSQQLNKKLPIKKSTIRFKEDYVKHEKKTIRYNNSKVNSNYASTDEDQIKSFKESNICIVKRKDSFSSSESLSNINLNNFVNLNSSSFYYFECNKNTTCSPDLISNYIKNQVIPLTDSLKNTPLTTKNNIIEVKTFDYKIIKLISNCIIMEDTTLINQELLTNNYFEGLLYTDITSINRFNNLIVKNIAKIISETQSLHFLIKYYHALTKFSIELRNNIINNIYLDHLVNASATNLIEFLKSIETEQEKDIIFEKINSIETFTKMIFDKNGKNIIEFILEEFYSPSSSYKLNILITLIQNKMIEFSLSNFSTFVVQKFIRKYPIKKTFDYISENIFCLGTSRNGVFVIVACLETYSIENIENLIRIIINKIEYFATEKYSSTLVEYVFNNFQIAVDLFLKTKSNNILGIFLIQK